MMGHRQQMTSEQRLKWDLENYQKRLAANKGSNFEYWNEKHEKLLQSGWNLFLITETPTTHRYSTSSVEYAKKFVEQLRSEGNYAKIVCGYNKNKQKVRMYSILFKPKQG